MPTAAPRSLRTRRALSLKEDSDVDMDGEDDEEQKAAASSSESAASSSSSGDSEGDDSDSENSSSAESEADEKPAQGKFVVVKLEAECNQPFGLARVERVMQQRLFVTWLQTDDAEFITGWRLCTSNNQQFQDYVLKPSILFVVPKLAKNGGALALPAAFAAALQTEIDAFRAGRADES